MCDDKRCCGVALQKKYDPAFEELDPEQETKSQDTLASSASVLSIKNFMKE